MICSICNNHRIVVAIDAGHVSSIDACPICTVRAELDYQNSRLETRDQLALILQFSERRAA